MKIALGHQARVGKDTFAEYVQSRKPIYIASFSRNLYRITEFIQRILKLEIEKNTALLQFIGLGLREILSENVWINSIELPDKENIIITDMRFPNEFEYLRSQGFITVKITRQNKPIDRNVNHISETALSNHLFDYTIENDGTIEEYYEKIDNLLKLL